MRVLAWDFGDRFDRFLSSLSIAELPMRWDFMRDHPRWRARMGLHGRAEIDDGFIGIWLKDDMSPEVAEETAAHELYHLEMVHQGFAYASVRDGQPTETWTDVATALSSYPSDIVVDSSLMSFGYTQESFRDPLYQDTCTSLSGASPETDLLTSVARNALGFYYVCRTITGPRLVNMLDLYQNKAPLAARVGAQLMLRSQGFDLRDCDQYLRVLLTFRDVLQLAPYLAVSDPRTGSLL